MSPEPFETDESLLHTRRAAEGFPPGAAGWRIAIFGNLWFGAATGLVLGPLAYGRFGLALSFFTAFVLAAMMLGKPGPFLRYSALAPLIFFVALLPALLFSLSLVRHG